MATKILAASGGDYSDWATYVTYLKTLGTLTATERGQVSGEFNGGSALLTGAGCVPTSTFKLILEPIAAGKFTGNPLKYTDGARVLFDASDEVLQLGWDHTEVDGLAIRGTSAISGAAYGRIYVPFSITVHLKNIVAEENAVTYNIDDRGAASGVRENLCLIRTGGTSGGVRMANFDKTYNNCTIAALNGPVGTAGFDLSYTSAPVYINSVVSGYATDFSSAYSASSKNCATDKTSGASNIASMTGAQFSVASTDFVSVTNGTHDLRVASGSTKLKDLGAASGGTTTDILGNSISGGTRDIGAHEYQAAASGLAANPIFGGGAAAHPLGGFVV